MNILVQTTIGESRGLPRFWLEGQRLAKLGFETGQRLRMSVENGRLMLRTLQKEDGSKSVRISGRQRSQQPLLEVRGDFLAKLFGIGAKVVIKMRRGRMIVARHHIDEQQKSRGHDFLQRLKAGDKLRVASLYHGGGIIDSALHEGLKSVGYSSRCTIVSEIESKYIEASLKNNAELFDEDTIILNSPIEDLNYSSRHVPQVDLLIAGIPCLGASISGRSKNKNTIPEQHKTAGAQFYSFLKMIESTKPLVIILENVVEYISSASYAVINSVLTSNGYCVQEKVLNGVEFGALENRNRLAMVAVNNELCRFDIDDVKPIIQKPACLSSVLEPNDVINDRWKDYSYLRDKEEKDRAAGKGFMRQLLDPSAESVPTIGRGYNKVRSTEPQLRHPSNSLLTRLFTPIEHARIKGIPEKIISGLSATTAHEILGQSVTYPAFKALGVALGRWAKSLIANPQGDELVA